MLASRHASSRGFTLIEVMITIAILAILIALGFPSLQTWLFNSRIRTASEEMLTGLQLARAEAVRRNCDVEFVLGAAGIGWTVQAVAACPPGNAVTVIEERSANAGVDAVTVAPAPGGADTVTFNGLGQRATNADASATLTGIALDLPATVLNPAESRNLQINISLNGQIRLCDPTVTDNTDSRFCS